MSTYVRGVSVFISPKAKKLWDSLNEAIAELPQEVSCRESDPDAWFPDEENPLGNKYTMAKRLCGKCPVRDLCLEFALVNEEQHGLWGGMTHRERQKLRARGRGRPRA